MKIAARNVHSVVNQAIASVLIAILPSVTMAAGQEPAPSTAQTAATNTTGSGTDAASRKRPPLLTVVSPKPDDKFVSAKLAMTLQFSREAYRRSLLVKLNGKDITSLFQPRGACGVLGCTESAALTLKAGLKSGKNKVRLRIDSKLPWAPPDLQDFTFDWKPSSPNLGVTDAAIALAPSLAFTTVSNGGQYDKNPWFQIYSNALNGGTISYPSESPCTGVYQIVAINRQTLAEDSYACYGDDKSFTEALAALNPSDPTQKPDLVIAGTTWYNNASSQLNTSSIGGTDYSKYASADQPLGYMIIGVPGAAAGTAYETYYVSSNDNSNGSYSPRLNGILAIDSNNNYNFFEYDAVPYSVDAAKGVITLNGITYTPPATVQNGFWLLEMDRWNFAIENVVSVCYETPNSYGQNIRRYCMRRVL